MFTRDLVQNLNMLPARPWRELTKGKPITDLWLAQQLRPFDIRPRAFRIGELLGRGYAHEDFLEPARRYVAKSDWEAYKGAYLEPEEPEGPTGTGA